MRLVKPQFLSKIPRRWLIAALILLLVFIVWHITATALTKHLMAAYQNQASQIIYDRNGKFIEINPNTQGNYDEFLKADVPQRVADLLLKKEDKFFYWHPGINPVSMARDLFSWVVHGQRQGSSTLTQQLVKLLLANQNQRTWYNKLSELFYTEALEYKESKKQILTMYLNSAYFGSQAQGLQQAAEYYYDVPPENLNDAQILSLLSTLNSPAIAQPGSAKNLSAAKSLAENFKLNISDQGWSTTKPTTRSVFKRQTVTAFEINDLAQNCSNQCQLTIDADLTENIRSILERNLQNAALDTATNGAVVVIKLPENQILAIIGSPNPSSPGAGMQLDMALKPRPIGSTPKPFIYLNAFQKGARPYTLVDDSEIKYVIGTGFDFFPQNFDGQYRGQVTLHQALDNSLNIPSVQVLEYVGLDNFYSFLRDDLKFKSIQPLEDYQLGIALGGLESDLTTLSYYFTIFPQQGWLKPLTLYESGFTSTPYYVPPQTSGITEPKQVGQQNFSQLVNRILNDRDTGVDQFGIKSNLNLPFTNYALKTGTSRDYHDSWTVGYTPDFLVGVWVGNSDNRAMRQITGLAGAARIWHEIMGVMYNSDYNKNTPFDFSKTADVQIGNNLDFTIKNDTVNVDDTRQVMLKHNLILTPHDGDSFLLQPGTTIPLSASEDVDWTINGKLMSHGKNFTWHPTTTGSFVINASTGSDKKEEITVFLNQE